MLSHEISWSCSPETVTRSQVYLPTLSSPCRNIEFDTAMKDKFWCFRYKYQTEGLVLATATIHLSSSARQDSTHCKPCTRYLGIPLSCDSVQFSHLERCQISPEFLYRSMEWMLCNPAILFLLVNKESMDTFLKKPPWPKAQSMRKSKRKRRK